MVGLDERVGLFVLTLAVAGGMAALGRRGEADDVVIGTVFAWILGIGVLLLAVLATSASGGTGIAAANTLFGSIYSLTPGGSRLAAVIGLAVCGGVLLAVRPLLLATLDSELASRVALAQTIGRCEPRGSSTMAPPALCATNGIERAHPAFTFASARVAEPSAPTNNTVAAAVTLAAPIDVNLPPTIFPPLSDTAATSDSPAPRDASPVILSPPPAALLSPPVAS